jgi:glycosyltransferase involved in cell wall biosynthesis
MKVNLVFNRIQHHAGRSGYDRIARYLGERVPVKSLEDYMTRVISDHAWGYIADRSSGWMAECSGMDWYDTYSFSLEAAAILKLLWGRKEIYHILYGENTYRYLGLVSRLARWKGSRIVCSYHQPPQVFEKVVRCKGILRKLDAVIVVASNQAGYFRSRVGEKRVFVVPHGVDTDFFTPREQEKREGKVCLFVGQWLRDFDMLGKVVRAVGARDPEVTFKIITRQDYAKAFAGLKNVIALSGVADSDLLRAYQEADILVMPLMDCTANCAVLEGMGCGLPVVATDVGGIRDYVTDSCARLVPRGDVEGMCQTISALVSDHRLRRGLGCQSRLRAMELDWRNVADSLVGVYQAVMDQSRL